MRQVSIALLAALLLPLPALAGSFDRGSVAEQAIWALHVDVDAIKATTLGEFVLEELADEEEAENKFAAFQAIFSFDPRKDVSDVTVYGTDDQETNAVVLIRGSFDPVRLVTLIKANDGYEAEPYGPYTIHTWNDEKKAAMVAATGADVSFKLHGAIRGTDRVVMGGSLDAVKLALDVLDGQAPSQGRKGSLDDIWPSDAGRFFVAAADLTKLPQMDPDSTVIKESKAVSVALGEVSGNLEGEMVIVSATEEMAQQLQAVVQGMVAFGALSAEESPQLAEFARSIRATAVGTEVRVVLDYPMDAAIEFLEAEKAKQEMLAHPEPPAEVAPE